MGDVYPTIKAAVVQASPVFLNREASTEKACKLIREAGKNGSKIIAFPEGFIPAHPTWFHFYPGRSTQAMDLCIELFKNSIEIPGPEINSLCQAAKDAQSYVVIGVCERIPNTLGTLFNTQIYIGPDGKYIGKHQKFTPTGGERLVHTAGNGDTFGVFPTEYGPFSSLICGENSNPLAIFGLLAEGTRVHVMSWPNHIAKNAPPLPERVLIDSKAFAQMSKAFVLSACAVINDDMIKKLNVSGDNEKFLRNPIHYGGSIIVAPTTKVIAGPLDGSEEGILYADLDMELSLKMKLRHDFAGLYNRPDIFSLKVNRSSPKLYEANITQDFQFIDEDYDEQTNY